MEVWFQAVIALCVIVVASSCYDAIVRHVHLVLHHLVSLSHRISHLAERLGDDEWKRGRGDDDLETV